MKLEVNFSEEDDEMNKNNSWTQEAQVLSDKEASHSCMQGSCLIHERMRAYQKGPFFFTAAYSKRVTINNNPRMRCPVHEKIEWAVHSSLYVYAYQSRYNEEPGLLPRQVMASLLKRVRSSRKRENSTDPNRSMFQLRGIKKIKTKLDGEFYMRKKTGWSGPGPKRLGRRVEEGRRIGGSADGTTVGAERGRAGARGNPSEGPLRREGGSHPEALQYKSKRGGDPPLPLPACEGFTREHGGRRLPGAGGGDQGRWGARIEVSSILDPWPPSPRDSPFKTTLLCPFAFSFLFPVALLCFPVSSGCCRSRRLHNDIFLVLGAQGGTQGHAGGRWAALKRGDRRDCEKRNSRKKVGPFVFFFPPVMNSEEGTGSYTKRVLELVPIITSATLAARDCFGLPVIDLVFSAKHYICRAFLPSMQWR